MEKTWVLVADASRARIFASDLMLERLSEVRSLIHSQSRVHETDAYSDDRGRHAASGGFGRHGAPEPKHDLHANEATAFAREIASHLQKARSGGEFDKLLLVAPPSFLGTLRQKLGGEVIRVVENTIAKDYTTRKAHELGPLLRKQLAGRPLVG